MSTRSERAARAPAGPAAPGELLLRRANPAEQVALVARARRELLLGAHRYRLRRQDLEDCYSQATLELLTRALRGVSFASRAHVENALEQRFVSRIHDRRRALAGRSPMQAALETAISIGGAPDEQIELIDVRAELEQLVLQRLELQRLRALVEQLSVDQRRVLAGQLRDVSPADFCRRFGWSGEKYRKVAQRARARLRRLMEAEEQSPSHPRAHVGTEARDARL